MTGQHEDPQQVQEIHPALKSYRDSAPRAFLPPPAETVADRGARRKQRRIMVGSAAAVLAVIVGTVGIAATRPDPAALTVPSTGWPTVGPDPSGFHVPEPTATAVVNPVTSPKNVIIASSALLRPQDIGPGYTVVEDKNFGWLHEWGMRRVFQDCPFAWQAFAGNELQNGDIAARFDGPKRVSQHVNFTHTPYAQWQLNNIRTEVMACADMRKEDRHVTTRLMEEGFTGDQSMLVELVIADGFSTATRYHVFARRGAAFTEMAMAGDPQELKTLAGKAVERMCASLNC